MNVFQMKIRRAGARAVAAITIGAAAALLAGCPNPNAIGVQDTGGIQATCLQASNNAPVAGALVTVNATQNGTTHSDGTILIPGVPVGPQNVTADAAGLHGGPVAVTVVKDQTVNVTVPMYPTQ